MQIIVNRIADCSESTVGILTVDRKPVCFTLEDQRQPGAKVRSETRIPEGFYPIRTREHGGFYARYQKRFGSWHRGMLELVDVPGFTDILIHVGNVDDDTAGCLLVGQGASLKGRYSVTSSVIAYRALYRRVIDQCYAGNLYIEITNLLV